MSPLRDLKCQKCGKVREDVYFSTIDEIEFECECGCTEYELLLSAPYLKPSGTYSYKEKK